MKHKSNVAAGEFLIIALFHFYSLTSHSSLWREENPNNNKQLQRFKETISNAI